MENLYIKDKHERKYTLLILFLLIIPNYNYDLMLIIASILIILFSIKTKPRTNKYFNFILFLIFFILFTSALRYFNTIGGNFRDFKEAFRYIPILLVFTYLRGFKKMKITNFIDSMFIYIILDGIISFMQYNRVELLSVLDFVGEKYNSDVHLKISLGMDGRTLGLSSGPGQHGAMIAIIYVVMITAFVLVKEKRLKSGLGFIISFVIILSSGSRTAFVGISLVTMIIFTYALLTGNKRTKLIISSMVGFIIMIVYFLREYIISFRYLFSLFNKNTRNAATGVRLNISKELILNAFSEKPLWILIGYGKDFFQDQSGAMDNEYTYVFLVYGIVVFVLLVYILINFFYHTITLGKIKLQQSPLTLIILFVIVTGLIIAFPSHFFIDPKILTILSLLIAARYWEINDVTIK